MPKFRELEPDQRRRFVRLIATAAVAMCLGVLLVIFRHAATARSVLVVLILLCVMAVNYQAPRWQHGSRRRPTS